MMLLWAVAGVPLGVYNIVEDFNIALQIQPQILTFLSLVTWGQCMYYGNQWPKRKALSIAVPVALAMGGVEVGLIFALWKGKEDEGVEWPATLMAVLSAVLLCAGVARHYWDIYKMRTVRGISFLFVFIDALGDLTSLISVSFQPELDVLGMVIYGSELLLWIGVFACGGYYNFRPWVGRRIERFRSNGREERVLEDGGEFEEGGITTALERVSIGRGSSASSSTVFRTASLTLDD
jgi:PQ loop repeat